MVKEYLLNLNVYMKSNKNEYVGGDEGRVCWGVDEYDALNRYVPKYIRETNGTDVDLVFKLARLRPTGRKKTSHRVDHPSFFNCSARSYIKGLITRYMTRFMVSDTLTEIEMYRNEFEDFYERYKAEFPPEIVEEIYNQYNKRLRDIKNGEIKPISYTKDIEQIQLEDANRQLISYSSYIEKILKMSGFRLIYDLGRYKLYIPPYYETLGLRHHLGAKQPYILSPFELVLLFEKFMDTWTYSNEKRLYGINEDWKPLLGLLGQTNNHEDFNDAFEALKGKGLTPFKYRDQYGENKMYVLKREEEEAKGILNQVKAVLYEWNINGIEKLYK